MFGPVVFSPGPVVFYSEHLMKGCLGFGMPGEHN